MELPKDEPEMYHTVDFCLGCGKGRRQWPLLVINLCPTLLDQSDFGFNSATSLDHLAP